MLFATNTKDANLILFLFFCYQVYKLYLDKVEFDSETENELQQSHIERGIDIIDPQTYEENEIHSIGILYLKYLTPIN